MTDAHDPEGIPEELLDPETRGALAALRRARLRAERVAAATGTCIVMEIDGKIVKERPSCDDEASKGLSRPLENPEQGSAPAPRRGYPRTP